MVGSVMVGDKSQKTTFSISRVFSIISSGQIILENGAVYGQDGVVLGWSRPIDGRDGATSALAPLETGVLEPRTLPQVQARLLSACGKQCGCLAPGEKHQVGVAIISTEQGKPVGKDLNEMQAPIYRQRLGNGEKDRLVMVLREAPHPIPLEVLPSGTEIAFAPM
jgi:hypothetical protein